MPYRNWTWSRTNVCTITDLLENNSKTSRQSSEMVTRLNTRLAPRLWWEKRLLLLLMLSVDAWSLTPRHRPESLFSVCCDSIRTASRRGNGSVVWWYLACTDTAVRAGIYSADSHIIHAVLRTWSGLVGFLESSIPIVHLTRAIKKIVCLFVRIVFGSQRSRDWVAPRQRKYSFECSTLLASPIFCSPRAVILTPHMYRRLNCN